MNSNVATNGKSLVAVSDFDSAENYKVVYDFDRKRVLENPGTLMYNLLGSESDMTPSCPR